MPQQWSLIFLAFLIMGWHSLLTPNLAWPQQDAVWHLSALEGQVKVRDSAAEKYRPAKVGDLLGSGSAVQTEPGGRAMLFLPNGAALKLGEASLLEFAKLVEPAGRHPYPCTLKTGTLQFAVDFSLPRPDSQLVLATPTSRLLISRGAGFLVSAEPDRLVLLEGGPVSLVNQVSGKRLEIGLRQATLSEKDGRLIVSQISSGEVDQLLAKTQVQLAMPPIQSIKLPKPVKTPITLADQVRKPWPVLPPVVQSPNIWIHEKAVKNGVVYRRPVPRR